MVRVSRPFVICLFNYAIANGTHKVSLTLLTKAVSSFITLQRLKNAALICPVNKKIRRTAKVGWNANYLATYNIYLIIELDIYAHDIKFY